MSDPLTYHNPIRLDGLLWAYLFLGSINTRVPITLLPVQFESPSCSVTFLARVPISWLLVVSRFKIIFERYPYQFSAKQPSLLIADDRIFP
jgi:hypothetical protein